MASLITDTWDKLTGFGAVFEKRKFEANNFQLDDTVLKDNQSFKVYFVQKAPVLRANYTEYYVVANVYSLPAASAAPPVPNAAPTSRHVVCTFYLQPDRDRVLRLCTFLDVFVRQWIHNEDLVASLFRECYRADLVLLPPAPAPGTNAAIAPGARPGAAAPDDGSPHKPQSPSNGGEKGGHTVLVSWFMQQQLTPNLDEFLLWMTRTQPYAQDWLAYLTTPPPSHAAPQRASTAPATLDPESQDSLVVKALKLHRRDWAEALLRFWYRFDSGAAFLSVLSDAVFYVSSLPDDHKHGGKDKHDKADKADKDKDKDHKAKDAADPHHPGHLEKDDNTAFLQDVHSMYPQQLTALASQAVLHAAASGGYKVLKYLLSLYPQARNARDPFGRTILLLAALQGSHSGGGGKKSDKEKDKEKEQKEKEKPKKHDKGARIGGVKHPLLSDPFFDWKEAEVCVCDYKHQSILHLAAIANSLDFIREISAVVSEHLFVQLCSVQDESGMTPFDIAMHNAMVALDLKTPPPPQQQTPAVAAANASSAGPAAPAPVVAHPQQAPAPTGFKRFLPNLPNPFGSSSSSSSSSAGVSAAPSAAAASSPSSYPPAMAIQISSPASPHAAGAHPPEPAAATSSPPTPPPQAHTHSLAVRAAFECVMLFLFLGHQPTQRSLDAAVLSEHPLLVKMLLVFGAPSSPNYAVGTPVMNELVRQFHIDFHQKLPIVNVAHPEGLRMLSLDGGGTRGLVTVEMLAVLEQLCGGRPLWTVFDYIAGTSTGGLLAALLGIGKQSIPYCRRTYFNFARSVFGQKKKTGGYDPLKLVALCDQELGPESKLSHHTPGPDVMVTSVKLDAKLYIFRNYEAPSPDAYEGETGAACAVALRATSAAPTFFPPMENKGRDLVDGGMLVNSPSIVALGETAGKTTSCMLSLGTGSAPKEVSTSASHFIIPFELTKEGFVQMFIDAIKGIQLTGNIKDQVLSRASEGLQAAKELAQLMKQCTTSSEVHTPTCRMICNERKAKYERLNPKLSDAVFIELNDCDELKLIELCYATRVYLTQTDGLQRLRELVAVLMASTRAHDAKTGMDKIAEKEKEKLLRHSSSAFPPPIPPPLATVIAPQPHHHSAQPPGGPPMAAAAGRSAAPSAGARGAAGSTTQPGAPGKPNAAATAAHAASILMQD